MPPFKSTRRTNATPVGKPGGYGKMDNDNDAEPDAEGPKLAKSGKKSNTGKPPAKAPKGKGGFASLPRKFPKVADKDNDRM